MHIPVFLEAFAGNMTLDFRWAQRAVGNVDEERAAATLEAMASLESGAIANPDEGRMVGHYWLRAPELAPEHSIGHQITTVEGYVLFLVDQLAGDYEHVIVVGIGGSALGPQLVDDALRAPWDPRRLHFIDNTDPDGMARVIDDVPLHDTLLMVVSKSGRTPETRNGLVLVSKVMEERGVNLAERAIAVTGPGSALWDLAERDGWLATVPMWDWVGGRTSVTSAVGLLPMLLQGKDSEVFLEGAAAMDVLTRRASHRNPAMALALAWWVQAQELGRPCMVVLPYSDRLGLLARYLQQLVMESLGKQGHGLTVYGNKGSTDQHAYVQQLRDGRADFFAVFIEVLEERGLVSEVEPGVRAGDYLSGFLAGTRRALAEAGRESVTVSISRVDEFHLGALIALFERAVGFYAELLGINAYHQPGVEAGKRAASDVISLQKRLLEMLNQGKSGDAESFAELTGADARDVFHVLRHLARTGRARGNGVGLDCTFTGKP